MSNTVSNDKRAKVLKKSIDELVLLGNQEELSNHQQHLMNKMLKELHANQQSS